MPSNTMNRSDAISLALHRAIAEEIEATPIFVIERGLHNAPRIRQNSRGGARERVDRWVSLLRSHDLDGIRRTLIADDEDACEMRNSSVFGGVLTPNERERIVERVLNAA